MIGSLFCRMEFQHITAYQSDITKIITNILLKVEFPTKWKKLKRIKTLIDRWGESVTDECPIFLQLLAKFFDTYFLPSVSLNVRNYSIFHPISASRAFIKMFGEQSSKKILKVIHENLKVEDILGGK